VSKSEECRAKAEQCFDLAKLAHNPVLDMLGEPNAIGLVSASRSGKEKPPIEHTGPGSGASIKRQ